MVDPTISEELEAVKRECDPELTPDEIVLIPVPIAVGFTEVSCLLEDGCRKPPHTPPEPFVEVELGGIEDPLSVVRLKAPDSSKTRDQGKKSELARAFAFVVLTEPSCVLVVREDMAPRIEGYGRMLIGSVK